MPSGRPESSASLIYASEHCCYTESHLKRFLSVLLASVEHRSREGGDNSELILPGTAATNMGQRHLLLDITDPELVALLGFAG